MAARRYGCWASTIATSPSVSTSTLFLASGLHIALTWLTPSPPPPPPPLPPMMIIAVVGSGLHTNPGPLMLVGAACCVLASLSLPMLLSMLVSLEVCLCVCLLLFIHTHPIPETGADLPVLFPLPTTPPMSRSSPGSLTHPKPLFLSTEWPSQESTLALRSANGSDLVLLLVLSSMSFYPLFLPFSLSLTHTHTLSSRRLVDAFPHAALGIALAKDSVISQSDVFLASHSHPHHPLSTTTTTTTWGDRPVLLLIGLRLGIDGVNPIYYETIKASPASPVLPSLFSPSSTVSFHLSSVHRNSRRASLQLLLLCRITSRQFVLSRSSSSTTRHSPAIPSIHPCSRPSVLDPSSATLSFGLFRCRAQDLSL